MTYGRVRDGIRRMFRLGVRTPAAARDDAEAELRAYVAARVEHLVAAGWSPADAHAEAIRRLGGSFEHALRDTMRSAERRERTMRLRDYLGDMRDDLRFAARSFRREKVVAGFIVVTLALGIGANAAMFGVVDRILIRGPEHIADPGEVMRFYRTERRDPGGDQTGQTFGWVSYTAFRERANAFAAVAAYTTPPEGLTFGEGADAVLIPYGAATWDLFPLLGVHPVLGRFFNSAEDDPAAPARVVVLGHGFWQRAFGGDTAVAGRTVRLGNTPYTIIGVAPRGFTGPQFAPVDVWMPMSLRSNVTEHWPTTWDAFWLRLVARLKPGVTPALAADEATAAHRAAYRGNDAALANANIFVAPLSSDAEGNETAEVTIARWLVGVTVVVLLIACSNVANLLLARAVRRRREVAVRMALGSGRGRLVRLLMAESAFLASAGAVAAIAVAWGAALLMRNVLLPGIEWPSAPVDARVLAVLCGMALAVGVLTGLAPALRASRPDLTVALKSGSRDGGGRSSRLRVALTVAQAALSLVLLVGAGLFVRSVARVHAIDLGTDPERVIVVQPRYASFTGTPGNAAAEEARRTQVLRDAVVRARELDSAEDASLAIGLPFQASFTTPVRAAGWDSIPRLAGGEPSIRAVSDGYFATMRTRILEGRAFAATDREGSEPVAIVSRTMASTLWPGASALGECLYIGPRRADTRNACAQIVGVAADVNGSRLREAPRMAYYVPFGQHRYMRGTSLLVRAKPGRNAETIGALRAMLAALDPSIAYAQMHVLQERVDPQIRSWKLGATMFTAMGVLALVVAAAGLYSVMSYLVAHRTQEIGVRMALGAQASAIVFLVLRNGLVMAATGIVIGVAVALVGSGMIEPLLFETSARDPLVIGGVGALLLVVALIASVVPALRARRTDPIEALRAE